MNRNLFLGDKPSELQVGDTVKIKDEYIPNGAAHQMGWIRNSRYRISKIENDQATLISRNRESTFAQPFPVEALERP